MGAAQFTIPGGPAVPVMASIVALGILAGASPQQLTAGAAALAAGAILFLIATRTSQFGLCSMHHRKYIGCVSSIPSRGFQYHGSQRATVFRRARVFAVIASRSSLAAGRTRSADSEFMR